MDINNGYDRHLDPPDEEEAEYCEYCGQELVYDDQPEFHESYCDNLFCPEKFDKKDGLLVHEMAEHLAEVEQNLKDTQDSLKYVRNSLAYVEGIRQEREQTIETLEKVIEKLTQSQQGE